MTTLKKAAQQALEALERYSGVDQRACDAEDALRTALEQPEQEPVAWMADTGSVASLHEKEKGYVLKSAFDIPLYTTPPAAQPAQKDAARYQHIKGMARAMSLDMGGNHYWHMGLRDIRGPNLDEAIDRAIKAEGQA